jgi:hypothetical protein
MPCSCPFSFSGSLRTGYTDKVTLGALTASLAGYDNPGKKGKGASKGKGHGPPVDPFEQLGNGLRVV